MFLKVAYHTNSGILAECVALSLAIECPSENVVITIWNVLYLPFASLSIGRNYLNAKLSGGVALNIDLHITSLCQGNNANQSNQQGLHFDSTKIQ